MPKRKLSEAVLERDNLEGECKKLIKERDRLGEECKRLQTDLNASQTSLATMSFDADDDSIFEQSASVADLKETEIAADIGSPLKQSTQEKIHRCFTIVIDNIFVK